MNTAIIGTVATSAVEVVKLIIILVIVIAVIVFVAKLFKKEGLAPMPSAASSVYGVIPMMRRTT